MMSILYFFLKFIGFQKKTKNWGRPMFISSPFGRKKKKEGNKREKWIQ